MMKATKMDRPLMKHQIRLAALVILLATTASICGSCASKPDAEADARRAIAIGDRSLIGYMGLGLIVPGVVASESRDPADTTVTILPGISDTSPRSEIEAADAYARRYNQTVLKMNGAAGF